MADSKTPYSNTSKKYMRIGRKYNMQDAMRAYRSKQREKLHNSSWEKQKVNINDIVNLFAPGSKGHAKGVKFEFDGLRYTVKADMAAGYLRIYDKSTRQYVDLLGRPGTNENTHFKIKKRGEM